MINRHRYSDQPPIRKGQPGQPATALARSPKGWHCRYIVWNIAMPVSPLLPHALSNVFSPVVSRPGRPSRTDGLVDLRTDEEIAARIAPALVGQQRRRTAI